MELVIILNTCDG